MSQGGIDVAHVFGNDGIIADKLIGQSEDRKSIFITVVLVINPAARVETDAVTGVMGERPRRVLFRAIQMDALFRPRVGRWFRMAWVSEWKVSPCSKIAPVAW